MDFQPFHALRTRKVYVIIFSFHATHFHTLLTPLDFHAQWKSRTIQNELLAIVSDLVLERITTEVRKSGYFGIIMDETSDVSRTEEVSLCLRYVIYGETKEISLVSLPLLLWRGKFCTSSQKQP